MSAIATPTKGTQHVPTYCYQCVAGPDLLRVKVEDGVATEIGPNERPPFGVCLLIWEAS